jgi:Nucleotidyltransferase domain
VSAAQLRDALPLPSEAAIVAVGSAAQGAAGPGSDVDFLVLLPGDELPSAGAVRATSYGADYVIEADGAVLNPELVTSSGLERLGRLGEALDRAFGARAAGSRDPGYPYLQERELRVVDRLRTGTVLEGAERSTQWRGRLGCSVLCAYWATIHTLGAAHMIETTARRLGRPGGSLDVMIRARMIAEGLVLPALACFGIVVGDLKHAVRHADSLADRRPLPRALADLRELLFPDFSAPPAAYLRMLASATAEIDGLIRVTPEVASGARLLDLHGVPEQLSRAVTICDKETA